MADTDTSTAARPDDRRFCCFMDILGFKAILGDFDRAVDLYRGMATYIATSKTIDDLNAEQFEEKMLSERAPVAMRVLSDSIILSSRHWVDVVTRARTIQAYLFGRGILVRGGIAFGRHTEFDESLGVAVVSEALSRAYVAESRTAIYPRVVFDISALEQISASAKEDGGALTTLHRVFAVDDLGTWFLDIPFHEHSDPEKFLHDLYVKADSEEVMRKIRWLVDYYNYCDKRCSIQPRRQDMRSRRTPAGLFLGYQQFGSLALERIMYRTQPNSKGNLFDPETWS